MFYHDLQTSALLDMRALVLVQGKCCVGHREMVPTTFASYQQSARTRIQISVNAFKNLMKNQLSLSTLSLLVAADFGKSCASTNNCAGSNGKLVCDGKFGTNQCISKFHFADVEKSSNKSSILLDIFSSE